MDRLEGKVVIVTGGARGLGGAAAEALCAEGAAVLIADVSDDAGEELAARLRDEERQAHYLHLDVRNEDHWADAIAQCRSRWGGLTGLLNNAGVNNPVTIEDATPDSFRALLEVNLIGPFLGIKAALPALRDSGGGSIVNVASNSTHMALPTTALYGASKAAIANLAKTTAIHCALRGDGIRVNSVHPGAHLTDMMKSKEVQALPAVSAMLKAIPLGRMGDPAEFGKLIAFLMSDDSAYITATELFCDGGLTAVSFADPARS
ncbi:3alpha(or 20beta)-hydroxysteroid dehydrogenase [Sphingobium faniae]|nr:3alpha(or 20beta)-hydroxysteroid dehydrogenase [Sphingobium faniae]